MNIYDYRTIPPEESAYHARTSHDTNQSEYGDGDIPRVDLADANDNQMKNEQMQSRNSSEPESFDFGSKPAVKDIIPDEVPRRDGPGGN